MNHPVARDAKITLEDMENLSVRINLFERHLDGVPCEREDISGTTLSPCEFSSNISRMCPVCQIKMFYFHTVYNWDAYHPGREGFVGSFTE